MREVCELTNQYILQFSSSSGRAAQHSFVRCSVHSGQKVLEGRGTKHTFEIDFATTLYRCGINAPFELQSGRSKDL